MKFTVISVDDRCIDNVEELQQLPGEYIEVECVDGRICDISQKLKEKDLVVKDWNNATVGELGCWLSQFNCWQKCVELNEPLLVLEDDAIPTQNDYLDFVDKVPLDWDFISLSVPENQKRDFFYNVEYDADGVPKIIGFEKHYGNSIFLSGINGVAKVYQGYCLVATVYSPSGAQKLIGLARELGLYTPVDCFIFLQAHKGLLNGYAPFPNIENFFTINWNVPTTIHNTEQYHAIF